MTTAGETADILDVKPAELAAFAAPDLFNGGQELGGWLCRRSDHRYGALVLTSVGGDPVEPFAVLGTPKMHYPFGRTENEERRYHWPRDVVRATAWEKLDGTNIFAYCYTDGSQWWTTFKTRLTPTLRGSSTHGDFYALWSEVLGPIEAAVYEHCTPKTGLSFELYGHRNHHLVSYEEPLATALLFGVDQRTGDVLSPDRFSGLPLPDKVAEATGREGLTQFYEDLRQDCEARNHKLDDDNVEGSEGLILYIEDGSGKLTQWKCKPESIEALHWAGDRLPESVIVPTAWNALESSPVLTAEVVAELLAEEFSAAMIRNSVARIERVVERVNARIVRRAEVFRAYQEAGVEPGADKPTIMRAVAPYFGKSEMRDVHNALKELGVIE